MAGQAYRSLPQTRPIAIPRRKQGVKEESKDVMARTPPTCNLANARKVGPRPKGLQKGCGLVEGRKELISGILLEPLLGGALLGKHLYPM